MLAHTVDMFDMKAYTPGVEDLIGVRKHLAVGTQRNLFEILLNQI